MINNKQDWIDEAKYVANLMPSYMAEQSGNVDPCMVEEELQSLIDKEDWKSLHRRFEQIWSWLPDSPSIHRHPFGRLCDLCSEYCVFDEVQDADA